MGTLGMSQLTQIVQIINMRADPTEITAMYRKLGDFFIVFNAKGWMSEERLLETSRMLR